MCVCVCVCACVCVCVCACVCVGSRMVVGMEEFVREMVGTWNGVKVV